MKRIIYIFLFSFSFWGCVGGSQEEDKKVVVSSIEDTEISLSDGQKIALNTGSNGSSTIFLIRPGDYKRTNPNRVMAELNKYGVEYAEKLQKLLWNKQIDHIICIGAVYANQTIEGIASQKDLKVMHYSNNDYGNMLDYIFHLKKGENFLLVEAHNKIGDLLYTLSGNNAYLPMAVDDFDTFYIVQGPARTQVKINRLKL